MVEYADASIEDLAKTTEFLHFVKPSLSDKLVYKIGKPKPTDRSIIFYLMPLFMESGYKLVKEDLDTFMLSAEFITDHPFWDKKGTTE